MTDTIDKRAYAQPCGCGAPAGEECPHTPIRCQHEFWYGTPDSQGPWRTQPANLKEGCIRRCELCGFQEVAKMTWQLQRASYPALGGVSMNSEWKTIDSAPKDGTLLLLLLAATDDREHALDDTAGLSRTVGFNNFENDGEDVWQLAGWCWSHDHFTEGKGKPVQWMKYPYKEPVT